MGAINKQRYKTRFAAPYKKNGRTNFPEQNCPGIYIIKKDGQIRYIGYSASSVYKALYRHFQEWNDQRGERVTYKRLAGITVRVVYCKSGAYAAKLERALIIKYRPVDNPDKLRGYQLEMNDKNILDEMDRIKDRSIPIEVPF